MSRAEWLYNRYGRVIILQKREEKDFTEFVVSRGSDVSIFRVYGDNETNYRIYLR